MALRRFESDWDSEKINVETYFLDLIQFRNVSNEVAEKFNVWHESPQAILLVNGEVKYQASHGSISAKEIQQLVSSAAQ